MCCFMINICVIEVHEVNLSYSQKINRNESGPTDTKGLRTECILSYLCNSYWRQNWVLFCSISILSHNLGRSSGHHRWICNNPFHLDLFSAALVELAKSIPVHSLILSSHLFFCLPLFLFPFTVPCRIVFAKPEDLETWPNHLSFRFLTRVSLQLNNNLMAS